MDDDNFADELRLKTRQEHTMSNAAVNLTAPLALTSPRVYRMLLASFYWIFKAIEDELESRRRQHAKIDPIYFRELLRTRSFEEDLLFYYGPNYVLEMGAPSEATVEYVREMRQSIAADPMLLIAYCQTMYMAMLGGGAVVKTWVRKAFRVPEGTGTRIFDFGSTIKDVRQFKIDYAEALNSISLSREEKDRIIATKKRIFELNNGIFAELRRSKTYKLRVLLVVSRVLAIAIALFIVVRTFQNGGRGPRDWFRGAEKVREVVSNS